MFGKKPSRTPLPSISKVLTKDQDTSTLSLSHPKHIPLWASPLEGHGNDERGEAASTPRHSSQDQLLKHSLQQDSSPSADGSETLPITDNIPHRVKHADPEQPLLKTTHESSVIRLFYDLFFVANLTTFTAKHEVNDADTLKDYIGFFGILWFTWLQVALFDLRFGNDSAFERLCKLLQFGVMAGMAVVAPNFGYDSEQGVEAIETLALIIMASRFVLAGQYAIALWWLHDYKKARLPMIGIVAVEFVTAMVSLGIFFAFRNGSENAGVAGWYVLFTFEAAGMMLISGRVGFLSFRRTAIAERLGSLTLIILGEGVIGLTQSIAKAVENGSGGFTSDIIGQIIASVAVLYFLWMLYFDQVETERVGTLRQQYWIVLHFPYHVSVLLVVEGIAQLTVWRKLYDVLVTFSNAIVVDLPANLDEGVRYINQTFNSLYEQFPESELPLPDISEELNAIMESGGNGTAIKEAELGVVVKGIDWLADAFEVELPDRFLALEAKTEAAGYYGILSTYTTVFLYLFISAGLVLILLAALFWLGKRHKSPGEWISIGVRGLVGVALALVAVMGKSLLYDVDPNTPDSGTMSNAVNYFTSAWMVPTVALVYLVVIIVDNLLVSYVRSAIHKRQQTTKEV